MDKTTPHQNKDTQDTKEQSTKNNHVADNEEDEASAATQGQAAEAEAKEHVSADEVAEEGQDKEKIFQDQTEEDEEQHVDVEAYEQHIAQLEDKLNQLEGERQKLATAYARLRADLENVTRRKNEEIERLKETAAADLAKQLLPVVDNLERAAQSASDSEGALADGVRLVLRQFFDVFEAVGIQPVPGVGEQFDPKYHEAIEQVAVENAETGTIIDELQRGYCLGDTVLRPSMVRVAQ